MLGAPIQPSDTKPEMASELGAILKKGGMENFLKGRRKQEEGFGWIGLDWIGLGPERVFDRY